MSRRRFLRQLAFGGGAITAQAFLAACNQITRPPSGPPAQGTAGESGSPPGSSASPGFASSPTESPFPAESPSGPANPISGENVLPGSRGWSLPPSGRPAAEGYLSVVSTAPGEFVRLYLSSTGPCRVEWYRLGWYQGLGGRLLRVDRRVAGAAGPQRGPDPFSGLVEAGWPAALELEIGAEWTSGLYLAVLRPESGQPGLVPFVVRPIGESAPVLFLAATTTWQAYNNWGGKSLYEYNSDPPATASGFGRAIEVSYDRPLAGGSGAGLLVRWEIPFVRWQEREGRDVEYAADIDLVLHPELLADRRLIVLAGHHEYWSSWMRDALEMAIAAGTNVAFFSANEIYWQVRHGPSPLGRARRITCYKSAFRDPFATYAPELTTCRWREEPVARPEAALIGQMYGHVVKRSADWTVQRADHWLYQGTGLRDGDRIANLVGQEYDTYFPELAPAGVEILAQGPVDADLRSPEEPGDLPSPAVHTATMYRAESGATVFAAGTLQWSWGLDSWGDHSRAGVVTLTDPRVGIMTRNLFDRLGDAPS